MTVHELAGVPASCHAARSAEVSKSFQPATVEMSGEAWSVS